MAQRLGAPLGAHRDVPAGSSRRQCGVRPSPHHMRFGAARSPHVHAVPCSPHVHALSSRPCGERCSEHCSESSGDRSKSKLASEARERQLRQRRARPAGAARPAHTLHTVAALSTAVWASLVYSSYTVWGGRAYSSKTVKDSVGPLALLKLQYGLIGLYCCSVDSVYLRCVYCGYGCQTISFQRHREHEK